MKQNSYLSQFLTKKQKTDTENTKNTGNILNSYGLPNLIKNIFDIMTDKSNKVTKEYTTSNNVSLPIYL